MNQIHIRVPSHSVAAPVDVVDKTLRLRVSASNEWVDAGVLGKVREQEVATRLKVMAFGAG